MRCGCANGGLFCAHTFYLDSARVKISEHHMRRVLFVNIQGGQTLIKFLLQINTEFQNNGLQISFYYRLSM